MKINISKLLLILGTILIFTTDSQARHGGGWGGGWGIGIGFGYPYGYGYGYPYYGYGYGYPYYGYGYPYYGAYGYPAYRYPTRRRIIKRVIVKPQITDIDEQEQELAVDNAGYTHWRIHNTTQHPITAQGPTEPPITIYPNQFANVSHADGFDLTINYGKEKKQITTQKHIITVLRNANGALVLKDD